MLQLAQIAPLATGHIRKVYQHPQHADCLIKVIHSESIENRWNEAPWYRRRSRTGPYRDFVREYKEYIAALHHGPYASSPLPRIVGLEQTDLGLGQVVEKVCDSGGQGLAPTLDAWVRQNGFTAQTQAALDDLLTRLLLHNVIAADLHAWNVVYGSDSRGGPRLVMIDGFGEKNIIPHCSMSRRHNAARTRHKFQRMLARTRANAPSV
jgi:hypothetical protein